MHLFKLLGQDRTQASWPPVCSSSHRELLGVCGWAPSDLAWSRKGSPCCSRKDSRAPVWAGALFSHLQSGEWGPLPTTHPRLPFNPQLDRVTCLAFSWLESGASDSSCYIGGAGHRPGHSRLPPSPPALVSLASRQSHSGSFESWTPRSLK